MIRWQVLTKFIRQVSGPPGLNQGEALSMCMWIPTSIHAMPLTQLGNNSGSGGRPFLKYFRDNPEMFIQ